MSCSTVCLENTGSALKFEAPLPTDHICASSRRGIRYILENAYWHTLHLKFPVTHLVELHGCTAVMLSHADNVDKLILSAVALVYIVPCLYSITPE